MKSEVYQKDATQHKRLKQDSSEEGFSGKSLLQLCQYSSKVDYDNVLQSKQQALAAPVCLAQFTVGMAYFS